MKHPTNRRDRLRIKQLKDENKTKAGKVRSKKAQLERLKEEEADNDLRTALRNDIIQ